MKNLRLVTFAVFAVCAFCLSADAQKKWTYKGDNGAEGNNQREITIIITQRPNGYEVSGEYTQQYWDGKWRTCRIRGSYFPKTMALKANCGFDDLSDAPITGSKRTDKDELQLEVYGKQLVAKRPGAKSAATNESSSVENNNVEGTWEDSHIDLGNGAWKYSGTFTITKSANGLRVTFTGNGGGDNRNANNAVAFNGSRVTLNRDVSPYVDPNDHSSSQTWTGTLSRDATGKLKIEGKISGAGMPWEAQQGHATTFVAFKH